MPRTDFLTKVARAIITPMVAKMDAFPVKHGWLQSESVFLYSIIGGGASWPRTERTPEALFKLWDRNEDGKLVLNELPPNAKPNF